MAKDEALCADHDIEETVVRFVLPLLPPALLGLALVPLVPLPVRVVCAVGFIVLLSAWRFGVGRPPGPRF
jgi:hypothetical protein